MRPYSIPPKLILLPLTAMTALLALMVSLSVLPWNVRESEYVIYPDPATVQLYPSPVNLVFTTPSELRFNTLATIKLLLSHHDSPEQLNRLLEDPRQAQHDKLQATRELEATLRPGRSTAFDIVTVTSGD